VTEKNEKLCSDISEKKTGLRRVFMPLVRVFGNCSQTRIIQIFLSFPTRKFSVTELTELTDTIGKSTCYEVFPILEEEQIIVKHNKRYQLANNPLTRALLNSLDTYILFRKERMSYIWEQEYAKEREYFLLPNFSSIPESQAIKAQFATTEKEDRGKSKKKD